ncbi:MAG: DsrE/DsrF/DrsH-like family protein [SAR324 cluster bacterium]|nr:DsrE/DsrF/DrsH-like family protein [SAR324 cluster bacterium]
MIDKKLDERFSSFEAQFEGLSKQLESIQNDNLSDRVTLLVFSGDMDKLMSAFIIGAGAVAMGMEVSMYFTFWGLTALKKQSLYEGKSIPEKMMAMMLPEGPDKVGTSKMNMLGFGPAFFKMMMGKNNVETLPDLININKELGVKMIACQMTMGVMGITKEELIDDLEYGGAGTYIGEASDSKITLFI